MLFNLAWPVWAIFGALQKGRIQPSKKAGRTDAPAQVQAYNVDHNFGRADLIRQA